jgi:hypothetical protein
MFSHSTSVPKTMQTAYDAIVAITDPFCVEHLNAEYAEMCRLLLAKLARKRPSPLATGKPLNWAAAAILTIGRVNFLFDKTQTPYLPQKELCQLLGVSQPSTSARATEIMRMLKIYQMDPEWTLPSRVADNINTWLISVNGLILDARYVPRAIQVEALFRGMIPYLPETHSEWKDKEEKSEE